MLFKETGLGWKESRLVEPLTVQEIQGWTKKIVMVAQNDDTSKFTKLEVDFE